jgi:enediyne biosynthesis protein E4
MRTTPWVLCFLVLAGCQRDSVKTAGTPAGPVPGGTAWFEDITERTGLKFTHLTGTNYFMADQIGSGVALFDYDNDQRLDIYLVQNGGTDSSGRNQLFHQEPNGTFPNASVGSGLDVIGRGMGAIAGDVNNDGWCDLVVTEYGAVRLFQNEGKGKFREVTREAGLDNPRWAAPASFIDFDRDGWLDLAVGNYIDYDPTHVCRDGGHQEFCAPQAFGGTVTRLWRNATATPGATPRFEDRTESSGLTRAPGAALGMVCADFDGDGWPDIFCADDGRPNRLFLNRRDGTFAEEAASRGLAFNAMGATAANMGVAFGDVDGDGLGDLFVTHLTEEFHSLWKQGPRGLFADQVAAAGLQRQAWRGTGFGAVLADFNADGAPDLALANGLVRRLTPAHTPVTPEMDAWWARYAQKAQLFVNDGTGRFDDRSPAETALCREARVGRSLAVGDLDGDGAPDLITCTIGGAVRLLRNVSAHRGHWLRVRLSDPARGNRDAIGAEVVLVSGAKRYWAVLQPATSYLVSHEPVLHFGLGTATSVDSIEVLWPDGQKERFPGGTADRQMVLRVGEGTRMAKAE